MKTIDIYMKDLTLEKQQEIFETIDSPDLHINSYLFSLAISTGQDLDVDAEEARIDKDFNRPKIH